MRFKGIIFDFNGVLWWDAALQEATWSAFAQEARGQPFTADEIARYLHGRTNQDTIEYVLGQTLSSDEVSRISEEKETLYRQACLSLGAAFRLSPGAVELLDFLALHGIPRAIATSSPRTNLDFFVQHLGMDRWFLPQHMICDDGLMRGKPAPDIYLQAARSLELPPAECVVVEDAYSGIAAAEAAGIGYVVALGPNEAHEALSRLSGVGLVIESLEDLPRTELFLDSR